MWFPNWPNFLCVKLVKFWSHGLDIGGKERVPIPILPAALSCASLCSPSCRSGIGRYARADQLTEVAARAGILVALPEAGARPTRGGRCRRPGPAVNQSSALSYETRIGDPRAPSVRQCATFSSESSLSTRAHSAQVDSSLDSAYVVLHREEF